MRNILQYKSGALPALLLVGVVFLLLNLLTGLYSDDYAYAFKLLADKTIDLRQPIGSLWDILESQYNHYLIVHGRVLAIGLDQWFLFLKDKHIFDVCNTLVFVGFVWLLQRLGGKQGWTSTLFCAAVLFVFTRAFGDVFLWMTGCLNYLWGAFFNLAFLYVLQRHKEDNRPLGGILPMLLGLAAGWWQECFSIGIATALVTSGIIRWRRKQKCGAVPVMMSVGYLVGTLLVVFAPGTIDRIGREGIDSEFLIAHLLSNILYVLSGLRIFWLFIIFGIVACLRKRQNARNILHENGFLLLATGAEMLFLMMVGRTAESRAFFGVEAFSLVLLLRMIPSWSRAVSIAITAVFVSVSLPILHLNLRNYHTTQSFLDELTVSNGIVFFDIPHYSRTEIHYLGSRIQMDHHGSLFFREAAYYNKPFIMVLPKRMEQELYHTASFISPKNEIRPGEYSSDDLDFVVVPLPAGKPLPPSSVGREYVSFPSGNYLIVDTTCPK